MCYNLNLSNLACGYIRGRAQSILFYGSGHPLEDLLKFRVGVFFTFWTDHLMSDIHHTYLCPLLAWTCFVDWAFQWHPSKGLWALKTMEIMSKKF